MTPGPDAANAKSELRARLSDARRALDAQQRTTARAAVRAHVLTRMADDAVAGRPWHRVFAYEPLASEPGSVELLQAVAAQGAAVSVPILRADRDLDWSRWPGSTPLGVDAVAAATVLLVPALAVDRSGMRLGRGGGSYDRVLSRVGPGVTVAALLHRGELLDGVPAESWDRGVTAVVSPDGWHDFGPG